MAIERRNWTEDVTDAQQEAWGNVWTTVKGPIPVFLGGQHSETTGVVWKGWATGWQETDRGSLELRRRVELDDANHTTAFTFHTIAAGRWYSVDIDTYVYDLQAILDAEAEVTRQEEAFEEQLRQAQLLGGPPVPMGVGRAARRQPPR